MLPAATQDLIDPFPLDRRQGGGAFLGRADLRDALISLLHDRSLTGQPVPSLRELCREVANRQGLPAHSDLGWPADLANLADALCGGVETRTHAARMEQILRLTPAGASLEPVLFLFLLRIVDDPESGLLVRASGGQIAVLRQLKRLLAERLEDPAGTDFDGQSVHGLIPPGPDLHGRLAPPEAHYLNLATRAVAELDAASAIRWSWQAFKQRSASEDMRSTDTLRQWPLQVLLDLLRSIRGPSS